ncbi:MAG: FAD-dependent thymidylate synthase [Geminicoccaceae bacterium]|nr:FAD-dependent thymidylate synthase [Geminicoccaceae bacterium]
MPLTTEQQQEIAEQRAERTSTRRATVSALEDILYEPLPVLDQGFIRVIDYMGDDAAIVQAARVSYGKGTKHVSNDRGLINYLMRHRHTSPFEMCEIKLHIKLPIFVARQWIRHRTANVNEYSARYSILDDGTYQPEAHELAVQATTNRQGRGDRVDERHSDALLARLADNAARNLDDYRWLLNAEEDGQRPGLSRELARIVLPLSSYTQWYWKTDLHNLLHFLALRADPHAQYEIRVYADRLMEVLRRWVPLTASAFEDYRLNAVTLSGKALACVQRMLAGETVTQETSGLGAGEWRELQSHLTHG